MNTMGYAVQLKKLTGKEISEVLLKVSEHEHGKLFCRDILVLLQDIPDEKWDVLMKHNEIEEMF